MTFSEFEQAIHGMADQQVLTPDVQVMIESNGARTLIAQVATEVLPSGEKLLVLKA
jgi:hypothetical protein